MPVYLVGYTKRMLYCEQPTLLLAQRHLNTILLTNFDRTTNYLHLFKNHRQTHCLHYPTTRFSFDFNFFGHLIFSDFPKPLCTLLISFIVFNPILNHLNIQVCSMLLLSSLKFFVLSSMSYLSYLLCPTAMFNLPILLSAEGFTFWFVSVHLLRQFCIILGTFFCKVCRYNTAE